MPLEASAGVAWPPGVAIRYGCTGGRGVFCAVACAGVKAPELLPIETGGVLCPPLDDGVNTEPDWASEAGDDEVLTIGSAGEDGVAPGDRLSGLGVIYVGISSASGGKEGLPRLSGTATFRASAMAAARDEALGKRVAGSLARQRIITMTSAGATFGLMSAGEGGGALRCCAITAVGLSP
jgi:hypothetical protein